jgi:hypothetical protein
MQRCGADQQVFERDTDPASCLFTLNPASELGDFERHRMHDHGKANLLHKGASALTIRIALGTIDPMSQLDNCHRRKARFGLAVRRLHAF